MRPFRYWLDPIFIFSAIFYVLNRFYLAPRWGAAYPFLINHFGDVLLIPCALPLLLWLQRITRLRNHDHPPMTSEIVVILALWAVLFEGIFPLLLQRGVSDPLDLLAYAGGALAAHIGWQLHYRPVVLSS